MPSADCRKNEILISMGQPAIDTFFSSLAQDQASNVVGIILSSTGTDGTLGLRAIKGETGTLQDFDGNILAWNRGAVNMYGYSEADVLVMNIEDIVPPGKKDDAKTMIVQLEENEIDSFETQRLTKDGKVVDVWLTITKLVDNEGRLEGIATTERDISKYKQMEKLMAVED